MKKSNFQRKAALTIFLLVSITTATINAQCSANFNFTLGANGATTLQSTSTGTTSSTIYAWSTGYGNYYNAGSYITLNYPDNRIYTVTLTMYDSSATPACSATVAKNLTITSAPCFTSLTVYTIYGPNGQVTFWPYETGPVSGGYTYSWAFGDGGTSSLEKPVHTYTASGIYNTTVVATSYSSICTYTTIKSVSVTAVPCNISAGFNYTVGSNGQVFFSSTPTSTGVSVLHYWDFGDYSTPVYSYSLDTISHTFPGNLTYNVYHRAYYNATFNCQDTLIKLVSVSNMTNCSAFSTFTLQKNSMQNLTWDLWANYPPNASNASWNWGDNSSSTGLTPSHTYSAAGVYNICVTVSMTCGNTYSACMSQYVYRQSQPAEGAAIEVNVKKTNYIVGMRDNGSVKNTVVLWPNPNDGNFKLELKGMQANEPYQVDISNILGQTVYSETVRSENSALNKDLKLNDLPGGPYFLKVASERSVTVSKFIITK